jgi:hypothetical protein
MVDRLNKIWGNITYWPVRKYRQIKNVIGWIPVVWNQFDFDFHYSLEVFKHQLLKQAQFMESKHAVCVGSRTSAEKIRMIVRLMDKVYNEDYAAEYQERLTNEFGKEVLDFHFEKNNNSEYSTLRFKYETGLKYYYIKDKIKEKHDQYFMESQNKQNRAHQLLWKLIEFYIRGWWD